MKTIAWIGLLALLPFLNSRAADMPDDVATQLAIETATPDGPPWSAISPAQAALWIAGVRNRLDLGTLPQPLPADRGQLVLDESALRYSERVAGQWLEMRVIPFSNIVSVHTELHEQGTALLFVTEKAATGDAASHVFVILPSGALEAGGFATEAKLLIEKHVSARPRAEGAASRQDNAERHEKIAVFVPGWPPALVFDEPGFIAPRDVNRFTDSIKTGAAIGVAPIAALCSGGGCSYAGVHALILAAPMAAAGALVGAIAGIGREIAAAIQKAPPSPPEFSAQQVLATLPVLLPAVDHALGQPAFRACVLAKLTPGDAGAPVTQWRAEGRVAELLPAEQFASGSHDFLIEPVLSRVALVPAGTPDQTPAEMPVELVIEARLDFHDSSGGVNRDIAASWSDSARTMDQWLAEDGAALKQALSNGCKALADELLANTERFWRARPQPTPPDTAAGENEGPPAAR